MVSLRNSEKPDSELTKYDSSRLPSENQLKEANWSNQIQVKVSLLYRSY